MMLLVACGIDANDKVVPIAWALVPIENETWWTWFLGYLKHCISISESEDYIFISDREKGMATAVPAVFDKSIHLHCCYLLYLTSQFIFIVASTLQIIYSRDMATELGHYFGMLVEQKPTSYSPRRWKSLELKVNQLLTISLISRSRLGLGHIQPTLNMAMIHQIS